MEGVPDEPVFNQLQYTMREIFDICKENLNADLHVLLATVERELSMSNIISFAICTNDRSFWKKQLCNLKRRWKECNYTISRFYKNNENWLNMPRIVKNACNVKNNQGKLGAVGTSFPAKRRSSDTPLKQLQSVTERTKRRRTAELRKTLTVEELSFAAQMSLRSSGAKDAATVLHDCITKSPERASKYKAALKSATIPRSITVPDDVALATVISGRMSKHTYENLRELQKEYNNPFLPPYHRVLEAKRRCYPPNIRVSDIKADVVDLQSLLDHTVGRILLLQKDVILHLDEKLVGKLKFIVKWGCDGTSGLSQYKQKFSDWNEVEDDNVKSDEDEDKNTEEEKTRSSDANIFFTSLVPLLLLATGTGETGEVVVWKNPRPSSSRFCRPIKIQYRHETTELTIAEEKRINDQIKHLQNFKTTINGKNIEVIYNLHMTMIDGKVVNALTNTVSTQRCNLCQLTQSQFNKLEVVVKKSITRQHLAYGLSTLHAWLRFFDLVLHLGYKMDLKTWQARGTDLQAAVKQRKEAIQNSFKKQLGLIVDRPKQTAGNTNDGNTARRVFENSSKSAKILGVDANLMNRFHIILQTILSGYAVNTEKFKFYSLETAKIYVDLYPWYPMSPTVHKVLIYGHEIVAHSVLPVVQMSEDAQESRNKDIKRYQIDFARKCSRKDNVEDVFNRLLVSSDPLISSLRKIKPKKGPSLFPEALELLLPHCGYTPSQSLDESSQSNT